MKFQKIIIIIDVLKKDFTLFILGPLNHLDSLLSFKFAKFSALHYVIFLTGNVAVSGFLNNSVAFPIDFILCFSHSLYALYQALIEMRLFC